MVNKKNGSPAKLRPATRLTKPKVAGSNPAGDAEKTQLFAVFFFFVSPYTQSVHQRRTATSIQTGFPLVSKTVRREPNATYFRLQIKAVRREPSGDDSNPRPPHRTACTIPLKAPDMALPPIRTVTSSAKIPAAVPSFPHTDRVVRQRALRT